MFVLGDGSRGGQCGVDSDADGFPDNSLNCAGPHCKKDNCHSIPNISQVCSSSPLSSDLSLPHQGPEEITDNADF